MTGNLIAIVDNDPGVLQSLELLLSACGYRTKLFASAEELLIAASTLEAACLVADIQLSNVTGLELVHALCEQGFASPVIFITGSRDQLHQRQAVELGCSAFLVKPFSAVRLIEAVEMAIRSKLN